MTTIRPARKPDSNPWERMRQALWPSEPGRHAREIERYFAGDLREPLEVLLDGRWDLAGGVVRPRREDDAEAAVGLDVLDLVAELLDRFGLCGGNRHQEPEQGGCKQNPLQLPSISRICVVILIEQPT